MTGFTGKVDVGQGNSGALAALIAQELRLQADDVRLVLGDTDLCPYDLGTFGSRSMPDAAPLLAGAAAAARGILLGIAADRWSRDTASLRAENGAVVSPDGARAAYRDLLAGLRRIERAASGIGPTAPADWRVAGRPFRRIDAAAIVTGATRFPSDLTRPGMLAGRAIKPPSFGASVVSLETASAASLPNVRVVGDGARAGVVAPDEAAVREALGRVAIEWEAPPQPDERELDRPPALAPCGSERLGGDVRAGGGRRRGGARSIARAARADLHDRVHRPRAARDPRRGLAEWDGDRLTVWTGTQRPFAVREQLATELGLDEEQVRVVAPTAGGGFGGKHSGEVAVEAARLARAAGRPVQVRWTPRARSSGMRMPARPR